MARDTIGLDLVDPRGALKLHGLFDGHGGDGRGGEQDRDGD